MYCVAFQGCADALQSCKLSVSELNAARSGHTAQRQKRTKAGCRDPVWPSTFGPVRATNHGRLSATFAARTKLRLRVESPGLERAQGKPC